MSTKKKQKSLRSFLTPRASRSQNSANNTLTPEQKAKIEINRLAALERRKKYREQQQQQQSNVISSYACTLTAAMNPIKMKSNSVTSNISQLKRNRRQYCDYDSDNSPIQPRKKHKTSPNSHKMKDDSDDSDDKKECESHSVYDITASKNHNKRQNNDIRIAETTNSPKKEDLDPDGHKTLDRIAAFTLFANVSNSNNNNDNKDDKQQQFERDPNYQYLSYTDYKTRSDKRLNHKDEVIKKAAGASHRDITQYDWYKNPLDFKGRNASHPDYNASEIKIPHFAYKKMTPSQQQFWRLKATHFDGILCFKVGTFYELYGEDAHIGHKLLGLKYVGGETPHVGFNEKSYNKHTECFVNHGYKIYRVEQTESSAQQKARKHKLVERKVCEIITKGTIVGEEFLDERANFILSIAEDRKKTNRSSMNRVDLGICYMDYSTGKIYVGHFRDDRNRARLRTLLFQINPSEIVYKRKDLSKETMSSLRQNARQSLKTGLHSEDEFFSAHQTRAILNDSKYWPTKDKMPALLVNERVWNDDIVMNAIGGILYTLQHTMHDNEILPHSQWQIYDPTSRACAEYLTLDGSTLGNLEILRNEEGTTRGTLIEFVDHTSTKFGKRMMEEWLQHPLINMHAINKRLDAVQYFIDDGDYWLHEINIKHKLRNLRDLERLLHNLAVLGTKGRMMDEAVLFEKCWNENKVKKLLESIQSFEDLHTLFNLIEEHREDIKSVLVNDITSIMNEEEKEKDLKKSCKMREFGSIIKEFKKSFDIQLAEEEHIIAPAIGHNEEYDKVLNAIDDNNRALDKELSRIKQQLKCKSIKWYHKKGGKVSGTFMIEITKKAGVDAPISWHERGSTSKVVRYQTDNILNLLKVREKLLDNKETLLQDAARATFARFAAKRDIWRQIVHNVAVLDCLLSLAHVSEHSPHFEMIRPQFMERQQDENAYLEIRDCFHPCIDETQLNAISQQYGASKFIPNDTVLGTSENKANFVLVTGPNMGGKSTLLRQTCVAVILAHIGCFVPCSFMKLTPVDRIFTRIGASDRILAGQSTFMVELEETSNVLMHATPDSLVIFDELGRGTSTFDGTAIAFAVAKTLIDDKQCRCLFSTHYHGLCDSFRDNHKVAMYHMAFQERQNSIIFLYKFTKGICANSHGINCAQLAGLPQNLLLDAQKKSKALMDRMHSKDLYREEQQLIKQFAKVMTSITDN